jgi:Rps23 Pro-64 3,4-dihydroxylase Tpa1-like proline 4-hydroxylase
LDWLEKDAPWGLRVADFYEQYEFSLADAQLPEVLFDTFSPSSLAMLREHVASVFGNALAERIDVTAHKLISGQRIRIHNDFISGQESHRLLIQLNRGWMDENGGALVLFNSYDPGDVHRILRPVHNSGVLFEISQNSLHAVTPINHGVRFTLVLSFYHATGDGNY